MAITHRLLRLTLTTLPLLGLASGMACSLALKPDDSVEPCSNSDDCPAVEDNRYTSVCISADDADVDGVCVGEFVPLGCDPANYSSQNGEPHPLTAFDETYGVTSRYSCVEDDGDFGKAGCPPASDGTCLVGEPDEGLCPTPDGAAGLNLILAKMDSEVMRLEGQDIRDQFCKSFYCDDTSVCNQGACQPCDPDLPFGQGGCGLVYTKGEVSCAYVLGAELQAQCAGPEASPDTPLFGNCDGA